MEIYYALIQGGVGPDVWDREVKIDGVDFMDAAGQASARAEELGGSVVSLEQSQPEWREVNAPLTSEMLGALESCVAAMRNMRQGCFRGATAIAEKAIARVKSLKGEV